MKITYFGIFLTICSLCFGQNNDNVDYVEPIYPGCEKVIKESANCFQQKIAEDLVRHLQKYTYSFEYLNIPKADATIDFVINNKGELVLKEIQANHSQFKNYVLLAFNDLVSDLKHNKKQISPAKSKTNTQLLSVSLKLPISFTLNDELNISDNRLIAVLNDENVKYEIVLTSKHDYKIYEVNEHSKFYLGKYSTLQEIHQTLPYFNLINNTNENMILGEFILGKNKLSLQTKNIFHYSEFVTEYIVYTVKEKKSRKLARFKSLKDFKNSSYYQWIIR